MKPLEINENQWKSLKTIENQWKSLKPLKSMKIIENLLPSGRGGVEAAEGGRLRQREPVRWWHRVCQDAQATQQHHGKQLKINGNHGNMKTNENHWKSMEINEHH